MTNTPGKSELLPCPFCGGPAAAQNYRPRSWGAGCISDECQWQRTAEAYAPSRQKAVELWNTRASSRPPADQVPDMVERLGETLHDLSDSLRQIGFFSGERKYIARYEAVVSAFENLAALQAVPASGKVGEVVCVRHEPYHGRCVHCDVAIKDGKPVLAALKASGEE